MLELGEIVNLSDDKEYIVANILNLHTSRYVFLVTNSKPLELVVAKEKIEGENIVLEEVKDNSELDYVLSNIANSKD